MGEFVLASAGPFPLSRTVKSPSLAALGNANIGSFNNEASLEINSAGLGKLEYSGISFGTRGWIAGMYILDGKLTLFLPMNMGVGVGINYFGFGRKGIEKFNEKNESLGNFDLGGILLQLGYGISFPFGLSLGISLEFFNIKKDGADRILGGVVALGIIYTLKLGEHHLDIGANIKNTLAKGYWGEYLVGATLKMKNGLDLMVGMEPSTSGYFMFDLGLAFHLGKKSLSFTPKISLRQGINDSDGGGINFGFDTVLGGIKFDLGLSVLHNLDDFTAAGTLTFIFKRNDNSIGE